MKLVRLALVLGLALSWLACGGSDGGGDVSATDTVDVSPDAPDALPDGNDDDVVPIDNEWGFPMRVPQHYAFEYTPAWGGDPETIDALDADWLCTFAYAGEVGVVYLQNTPVRVEPMGMSTNPVFEGRGGWLWVDGTLTTLQNPYYDWGANHHNEYLEFDHGQVHVKVWHSSIGPGYRVCHTPDCLMVYDLDQNPVQDGCEPDRALPVTCSPIQDDGTWEPLVDTFQPCEGEIQ